ncbi:MAG: hypothetical protein AB7I59_19535 [Geminicoccaceae bacterium]
MRAGCAALLTTVLLAACATGPVEVRREVSDGPEQVADRIVARLTALGLSVSDRSATGLTARSTSALPAWATCPPRLVGGGDDRRVMASARTRQALVRVGFVSAGGGTRVEVEADFTAGYTNPIRAATFTAGCRSTGMIEAAVLEAAGR